MKKVIILTGLVLFIAASCNQPAVQSPPNNQPTVQTPAPAQLQTPTPTPTTPTPNPTPTPTPSTHQVTIQNFAFSSSSLTVKKGDTVVWTNKDGMAHTVTGDNGGPDSPDLSTNQTYSFRFNTTGTFGYHCAIHSSMRGTIIVQ